METKWRYKIYARNSHNSVLQKVTEKEPRTEWFQTNNNAFQMDPLFNIEQGFSKNQMELKIFFYITGQKKNNYQVRMKEATMEKPLEIYKRLHVFFVSTHGIYYGPRN